MNIYTLSWRYLHPHTYRCTCCLFGMHFLGYSLSWITRMFTVGVKHYACFLRLLIHSSLPIFIIVWTCILPHTLISSGFNSLPSQWVKHGSQSFFAFCLTAVNPTLHVFIKFFFFFPSWEKLVHTLCPFFISVISYQ